MAYTRVEPESVSVVIQGPLYRNKFNNIFKCIESIEKCLPGSEIIVSTWADQSVDGLDNYKLIMCQDPDGLIDKNGHQINIGRQIVSTRAGIEASTRDFVLKFRADFILETDDILRIGVRGSEFCESNKGFCFFEEPVTITNIFSRSLLLCPLPYHFSDTVQFGRRADLVKLWNQSIPDQESIFHKNNAPRYGDFMGFTNIKILPEQYLITGLLRSAGWVVKLKHASDTSFSNVRLSELFLVCNFFLVDYRNSGVKFPSHFYQSGLGSLYSPSEVAWLSENINSFIYVFRYLRILWNQYKFGSNKSYLAGIGRGLFRL